MKRKILQSLGTLGALGLFCLCVFFLLDISRPQGYTSSDFLSKISHEGATGNIPERIQNDSGGISDLSTASASLSCEQFQKVEQKDQCFDANLMVHIGDSGDLMACNALRDPEKKITCRTNASHQLALSQENKAYCIPIPDAQKKQVCREAVDGKKLVRILKTHTATQTLCMNLEKSFQSECLRSINSANDERAYFHAKKVGDPALCTSIQEKVLQQTCHDSVLFEKARKEEKSDLCLDITNTTTQTLCQKYFSPDAQKNLFEQALKKADISLCEGLEEPEYKKSCHDIILLAQVRKTQNPDLCSNLSNTGFIENCKRIELP